MTPATTPALTRTQQMVRGFALARDEKLVAYPNTDGTWSCKTYTIRVGESLLDCSCSCGDHHFRGRICKHLCCVIFARKYGIRPVRGTEHGH